jgi:hypothetical protein
VNKIPFFVPLGVGVESDVLDKLVQPGSVLALENAVSNYRGEVIRRAGSSTLSASNQATLPSGGTLPNVWQLATLAGSLVRFNKSPSPIHIWTPEAEAWVRPSDNTITSYRTGPISTTTSPVFSGTPAGEQVRSPTVAASGNYAITAYEYSSAALGGACVVVVVQDVTTKTTVFRRQMAVGTRTPRVIVVGARAVVVCEDGGGIQVDAYDLASLSLVQQLTAGDCTPGTAIDVRAGSVNAGGSDVSVLYRGDPDNLSCLVFDAANLATNETFECQGFSGGLSAPDLGFAWMQDFGNSGKFSAIVASTTDGLNVLWDLPAPTAGFSEATATHVLDATAIAAPLASVAGIRNLIGTTTSNSSSGLYRVLYEVTAPDLPTRGLIKQAVWSGSANLGTAYRGVGIRSKIWADSTNFHFWAAFAGTDQKTYFNLAFPNDLTLSTVRSAPQATAFVRSAGGLTERLNHPSQVATGPDGEFIVAVTHETRTESIASAGTAVGATAVLLAIDLVSLTHRTSPETELGRRTEFLGAVFTPGGLLGCFDGQTYGTPSFAYYLPSIGIGSAAGGNLEPSANYVYRVCYAFVDHNGRKWRSAPSAPTSIGTTGTDFKFNLTIETLRLVDRANYQIEVYRTQADAPDAYFLVASIPNDPTATQVTLTDNVADEDLGEELYTDGGGLENELTPAASHVVQFQNRLVMAEAGRGTLWYSLDADLNHGLLFNEALTLDVGDPGDPITGLAATDTYLVVFKRERVYVVAGQGANSQGQGASYDFRLIASGVGCSVATSILPAPDGSVWFKSNSTRAGFHRVNGLSVEYVGQGVRAHNNLTITAAVVVDHLSQLRFYSSQGTTLVFNWVTNTWSTNTGQQCRSALTGYTNCSGVVLAHASNQSVLAEGDFEVNDGPFTYTHHIRSPWLSVAQMDGWERICRIQGVGTPFGAHRLEVKLYRDFDLTDQVGHLSKQFDGTETKWEWEVRPKVQKLSSLLIDVEVLPYQPPIATFEPERFVDDEYLGGGAWHFENGGFDAIGDALVGGTVVVTGGPPALNGTYTVTSVTSDTDVQLTPSAGMSSDALDDAEVVFTYTPDEVTTSGPGIAGVSLVVGVKRGLKKLPATSRLAPTS